MRLTKIFLVVAAFSVALTSCQKEVGFADKDPEPGGSTKSIIGDWSFVGMAGNNKTSSTISMGGDVMKSTLVVDYVTQNNAGTVKITNTDFIYTDLKYDINTTGNTKSYVNGILLMDKDMPIVMSAPPMSATNPYTRNTSDSITVIGSSLGSVGSPVAPVTAPIGMKISWSGDTLVLKCRTAFTTTADYGGMPATIDASTVAVMKLKKL
jgi:hypothetical protein